MVARLRDILSLNRTDPTPAIHILELQSGPGWPLCWRDNIRRKSQSQLKIELQSQSPQSKATTASPTWWPVPAKRISQNLLWPRTNNSLLAANLLFKMEFFNELSGVILRQHLW